MITKKPRAKRQPPDTAFDVSALLKSLQTQLEDTRKQLMDIMNKPDPKDLTVRQVIDAYLTELPDAVTPEVLVDRKRVLGGFANFCGSKRISECGPLDITGFFKSQPRWKSGWTNGTKLNHLRRAFNWAMSVRLIREYPFRGIKGSKGPGGRPMLDEAYRILLKNSPPRFRRFLTFLRFTGCRPNEASRLRWSHIDWERSLATLEEHKTAKVTGKPRVLFLHPVLIKLLRWIHAHQELPQLGGRNRTATVRWLANLLRDGPMKVRDITSKARPEGISLRMLYRARGTLGVKYKRTGGKGKQGYTVYYFPGQPPSLTPPSEDDHVFTNWNGNPWSREAMACKMRRLRSKGIIKMGVKLYGLRHRLATEGVKRGINLIIIAGWMGHTQISTTAKYCSTVKEDTPLLLQELQKINQCPKKVKGQV